MCVCVSVLRPGLWHLTLLSHLLFFLCTASPTANDIEKNGIILPKLMRALTARSRTKAKTCAPQIKTAFTVVIAFSSAIIVKACTHRKAPNTRFPKTSYPLASAANCLFLFLTRKTGKQVFLIFPRGWVSPLSRLSLSLSLSLSSSQFHSVLVFFFCEQKYFFFAIIGIPAYIYNIPVYIHIYISIYFTWRECRTRKWSLHDNYTTHQQKQNREKKKKSNNFFFLF